MADKEKDELLDSKEQPVEETKTVEPEEAKEEQPVEETTEAVEETKAEEPVVEEAKVEEPVVEEKVAEEPKKKEQKAKKEVAEVKEEPKKESSEEVREKVEKKIRKEIEKKQEKQETMGFYRIAEYLKTEHKWENYLFVFVSMVVMVLGGMILAGSLVVKDSFPLIGSHPTVFAWILIGVSAIALVYSLYPFFKPAFPEFRKITWLTFPKFVGDAIRVFLFIAIFVLLFILYDSLITGILRLIF